MWAFVNIIWQTWFSITYTSSKHYVIVYLLKSIYFWSCIILREREREREREKEKRERSTPKKKPTQPYIFIKSTSIFIFVINLMVWKKINEELKIIMIKLFFDRTKHVVANHSQNVRELCMLTSQPMEWALHNIMTASQNGGSKKNQGTRPKIHVLTSNKTSNVR